MRIPALRLVVALLSLGSLQPGQAFSQSDDRIAAQARLWMAAESSGLSARYQYYLEKFPDGVCSDLAQKRMTEAVAWEEVKNSYNSSAIETYLRTNLSARFAEVALERLRLTILSNAADVGTVGRIALEKRKQIKALLPPLEECEIELLVPPERLEARLWMAAESSGLSDRYQYYLEKFPDGVCSDLAQKRVKEAQAWEGAKDSVNSLGPREAYLGALSESFGEAVIKKLRDSSGGQIAASHSGRLVELEAGKLEALRARFRSWEECEIAPPSGVDPDVLSVGVDWEQIQERIEAEPVEVPLVQTAKTGDAFHSWKARCRDLGFAPGTENFGQCVLRLMDSGTGSATAEIDTESSVAKADVPVAQVGERLALVIGNASYTDAPLANPLNDSELMSRTLRDLGFLVTLVQDVTQMEMKQAIVNFGIQLENSGSDAVGLFYYAGHGVQVRGSNYLMPVGTPYIGRAADVDVFALDANEVLDQMYFAGNAMNVVILDACRNNPYFRRFRGTAVRGLARMEAPRGTIIAYSTRPGDLASDGTGEYSPYTEALVRAMRIPGLSLSQVFIQTRVAVMEATQQQQVPWEEGGLTANFYFRPLTTSAE
jgi:hypothetical protein